MKNTRAESVWQDLLWNKTFRTMVESYKDGEKITIEDFMKHDWGFNIHGMEKVIAEYLQDGKVTTKTLLNANTTGCKLRLNYNNKQYPVSIDIGTDSTKTDVDVFWHQKKTIISIVLEAFKEMDGKEIKKTKNKVSKNSERDHWILSLNNSSLSELNLFVNDFAKDKREDRTREICISLIIKGFGYSVTPDAVRNVIQRNKII